jgi:hypothetical protein
MQQEVISFPNNKVRTRREMEVQRRKMKKNGREKS